MKLTNVLVLLNRYKLAIKERLKLQVWPVVHDDKELQQQKIIAYLKRTYKK